MTALSTTINLAYKLLYPAKLIFPAWLLYPTQLLYATILLDSAWPPSQMFFCSILYNCSNLPTLLFIVFYSIKHFHASHSIILIDRFCDFFYFYLSIELTKLTKKSVWFRRIWRLIGFYWLQGQARLVPALHYCTMSALGSKHLYGTGVDTFSYLDIQE